MAAEANPHHAGNPSIEFKDDGKKEMRIPAKDLNIVWGKDPRYWKIPNDDESPAELIQVYWMEVTGCVDKTSRDKKYEVGFDVSLTADAFGWGGAPLYLMVKRGKDGNFVWKKYFINTDNHHHPPHHIITGIAKNSDDRDDDPKLYFGLYEVWSGKWKGGLKIHHAFIRELPAG